MGLFPRLFWFGFGAFAATWWAQHHRHEGPLCNRRQQYIKDREEQEQSRRAPLPSHTPVSYPPVRTESDSWTVDKFDREKIRELGTQATDALADASEAMLESAFSALEILRNRLHDQRVAKEKHQAGSKMEPEFPRPS